MWIKYFFQKLFHGYSDRDLWSLDYTIAKWILPRLQAFRKTNKYGFPSSLKNMKNWNTILNKIIFAFKFSLADCGIKKYEEEIKLTYKTYKKLFKKYEEGLKLFAQYFGSLWD